MTPDPARCIPILASLDLAETLDRDQLGFTGESHGDYAIVKRQAMELHFWLTTRRVDAEHTACTIRGGQVPALHAEFAARGVPRLTLRAAPLGHARIPPDRPARHLLRFGCAET